MSQTLESLEILLIGQQDAHSLAAHLPADPRIRLVARKRPGIVSALNTGLALARGEWIARMDDDDLAYPQRLATQLEYLQAGSARLCGTEIRFIDTTGGTAGVRRGNLRYQQWLNAQKDDAAIRLACLVECPLPHPTLMAHRDTWSQLQGYREFDGPEDYDLVLRALSMGIPMGKPDGILLDWREHPERLTHTDDRYRREAFARCRAWVAARPASGLGLAEGRGVWLCGVGRHARQWHDALEALGVQVIGFVDIQRHSTQRSKRCKPVISYEQLVRLRTDELIIGAVTQPAALEQLQEFFRQQPWKAGQDYVIG